jgi:hypothetical protein
MRTLLKKDKTKSRNDVIGFGCYQGCLFSCTGCTDSCTSCTGCCFTSCSGYCQSGGNIMCIE